MIAENLQKIQSQLPPQVTLVAVSKFHPSEAIREAWCAPFDEKPKMIIANTIKGKGVSFMENDILWHYRWPREDEMNAALAELKQAYEQP